MTTSPFPSRPARARAPDGELYVIFRPPGFACGDLRGIPRDMDLELSGRHDTFLSRGVYRNLLFDQKEILLPSPSRDAQRVAQLPPAEAVEVRHGDGTFYVGAGRFCSIQEERSHRLLAVDVAQPVPAEELASLMEVEHLRKLEGRIPPGTHARLLARKLAET
jgi:hypothetical protein